MLVNIRRSEVISDIVLVVVIHTWPTQNSQVHLSLRRLQFVKLFDQCYILLDKKLDGGHRRNNAFADLILVGVYIITACDSQFDKKPNHKIRNDKDYQMALRFRSEHCNDVRSRDFHVRSCSEIRKKSSENDPERNFNNKTLILVTIITCTSFL